MDLNIKLEQNGDKKDSKVPQVITERSTETSSSESDDSVEQKTTHKRQERLWERQRIAEQKDIQLLNESSNEFRPTVEHEVVSKCPKRLFCDDDTNQTLAEAAEGVRKLTDYGGVPWDINPEKRQYIVIISSARQDQEMNKEDFNDVCYEYSQCFKSVEKRMANILSFLANTPLLFEGKLYIMCNNEATSCWVRHQHFTGKWLVERFEVFHHLRKCRLVVPYINKIKGTTEILQIFEAQNVPLKTDLWVIRDCRKSQADDDYTPTSFMGDHAIVKVLIDGDSEQLLVSLNYQLKYCFWKIDVKMC